MIERNILRPLSSTIALVALATATPGTARPGADGPLFDYYYYSDASHQTQTGYAAGVCYSFGPGVGSTQGQASGYYEKILVGECRGGVTIYL